MGVFGTHCNEYLAGCTTAYSRKVPFWISGVFFLFCFSLFFSPIESMFRGLIRRESNQSSLWPFPSVL